MALNNFLKKILYLLSLATTLFVYRPIFQGNLLGDPFDARLQLILHEHWWRWFNGLVEFRNTEFFFPFKLALGYSDVFLVQGFIYSFFRWVNFDLTSSWTLTTIFLVVIGNFSWVVIAFKYIKNFALQILLILTSHLSLSFVFYFTLNPNIVGYAYLPWIYLMYENTINEKNLNRKQIKIHILIILFLIYALSCWYGAFFVILTAIIKLLLEKIPTIITLKKINIKNNTKINFKLFILFFPLQIFLIYIFYFIYITVANQPYRPTEEMLRNSPKIEYLPNGASASGGNLSGSIFKLFYDFLNLDFEHEYTIGIGLTLCLFGLLLFIYNSKAKIIPLFKNTLFLSIILTYLYFLGVNNFSVHKLFFENVIGFNSIRTPSRYVIIVGFFVIFCVFYILDRIYSETKNKKIKFLILVTSFIIFIDQYRNPFTGWDRSSLINTDLMSKKSEILNKCDYFYYDKIGGWWYDQIEAMTFSSQVGVPTVNGYSGAFPPGYPNEDFNSTELPNEIFDWIAKIDKDLRGCFIAGSTPMKTLNRGITTLDLIGFSNGTKQEQKKLNLALSPNPYLYIVNYSKNKMKIEFTLSTPTCRSSQDVRITEDGVSDIFQGEINKNGVKFEFEIDFSSSRVKTIEIITKSESCISEDENINLFFELDNLKYYSLF